MIKVEFDWRWEWSFKKIILLIILAFNIFILCVTFNKSNNRNDAALQNNTTLQK
jgi:hypothetical protein